MDKDNVSDTQKDLSPLGEALSAGFQEGMDIDRGDHIPGQGFCDCWKSFVWGSTCSIHSSSA